MGDLKIKRRRFTVAFVAIAPPNCTAGSRTVDRLRQGRIESTCVIAVLVAVC
jgi:hypothetical protein